ncbi:MAG: amidase [Planctomycetes bacterium]|nr:amidase [Planctomycetota bacterium]
MEDHFQQLCDPFVVCASTPTAVEGPLHGLRVAVKDNIDVAGLPTAAGNPHFAALRGPVTQDHACVATLRHAGALILGKTVMDEFAYGADGGNAHYGTPLNPRAPEHTCGGSSCGSASAVAQGLADIGLGTDTGGSTRIPPAATGLFGLRPTHGAVSAVGVVPLAPSFDTVGWMTRDSATMQSVSSALLRLAPVRDARLLLVPEIFAASDTDLAAVALAAAHTFGACKEQALPATLAKWFELYVGLTRPEIRAAHENLVASGQLQFGRQVGARLALACGAHANPVLESRRAAVRSELHTLLQNCVLVFPTLTTRTPRRDASDAQRDACRARILPVTVIAALLGCPELTVPVGVGNDGFPVALSLLGAPNSEATLLHYGAVLAGLRCDHHE